MDEMLRFLSVPENRIVLTWLGGGLSTAAAGLWIAAKYFIDRKDRLSKKAPQIPNPDRPTTSTIRNRSDDIHIDTSQNNTVSVGRGVAIGAGAKIHSSNINVGFGLRAVLILSIVVGITLVTTSIVFGRLMSSTLSENGSMPEMALLLSCGSESKAPYQLDESEANQLTQFIYDMEQYAGKPVYVSVRIEKECAACACYRQSKIPEDIEIGEWGAMFIDAIDGKDRWNLASTLQSAHQITAIGPPFARSLAIFLPTYEQLPTNGLFSRGEYGSFLTYEGPFVPVAFSGTGYEGNFLEPLSIVTPETIQQIGCVREGPSMSPIRRLLKGCTERPN